MSRYSGKVKCPTRKVPFIFVQSQRNLAAADVCNVPYKLKNITLTAGKIQLKWYIAVVLASAVLIFLPSFL